MSPCQVMSFISSVRDFNYFYILPFNWLSLFLSYFMLNRVFFVMSIAWISPLPFFFLLALSLSLCLPVSVLTLSVKTFYGQSLDPVVSLVVLIWSGFCFLISKCGCIVFNSEKHYHNMLVVQCMIIVDISTFCNKISETSLVLRYIFMMVFFYIILFLWHHRWSACNNIVSRLQSM